MGRAVLGLELQPPVAGEQNLDPDVSVVGRDQIAAVRLQGPGPKADADP